MEDEKKDLIDENESSIENNDSNLNEDIKLEEKKEDSNIDESLNNESNESEEIKETEDLKEVKEEPQEEVKEEPKEEAKEEIKEEPKEKVKEVKKEEKPKKAHDNKKKESKKNLAQKEMDNFKIEESAEKKSKKKKFTIIELIIIGIVLAAFITLIVIEMVAPNTDLATWVKDNVWNTEEAGKGFMSHVPTLIQSIIYVIVIYAVCKLIRIILQKRMLKSNRSKTVLTLMDGLIKYACAIAIIIFVLQAFGVNSTAIFASVGILTLVIGLGCQSLIADVVAGLFIVFEDEYNVGEIITIGDFRGTVIEIGIRATKILDAAGNIKIINNSDISNVINMSRELSLAVVDCEFPYDVPIEIVEGLLKDNFDSFKEKIPAIIEGPFYKGVSGYGDSNVAVKIVAKCHEEDRYQVQRDLLRAYRKVFTEAGIDLSFNQVVVQQYTPTNYRLTNKMKKEAENFVDEQKELSKTMDGDQKI